MPRPRRPVPPPFSPSLPSTPTSGGLSLFHPAVQTWFENALGAPTPIQTLAWPPIAKGETTLLLAPTGSGKTLAAFLATLDRLARSEAPDPSARLKVLYISPLKALAVDVERNLRAPLRGILETSRRMEQPLRALDTAVRTGDTLSKDRARILRTPPDILITTPESVYLLLTSQQRSILSSVDTVILDEIHQLVASKRGAHLALSLERLEALRPNRRLQRIGLSATQKPLDEVARFLAGYTDAGVPRPVSIVDASAKKALSVSVEVPPPLPEGIHLSDDETTPEGEPRSIWPRIHYQLLQRLRQARSTIVFVNSRRLAERVAGAINEMAGEEVALAHHGSLARETRSAIEERLKAGALPCIVATSSLELGIDMGAVDQVIQVEAPPSIAAAIQRIGRASHHVGGVPSGVLVPKHKHDLLSCAAAVVGIEEGAVEETYYPRNPLDVLAQQIVAITALGLSEAPSRSGSKRRRPTSLPRTTTPPVETNVDTVWDLVRRAAPYHALPRSSFDGVLDMLSGRYPSDEFIDLRPRLHWDRSRGVLAPRASSQRLAILNGGTIPDRGLYGVFLRDDGDPSRNGGPPEGSKRPSRRVGELDEEMVFELREGEVFLLGASSWRAEQITRDKVLVTPAPGLPGKMPFWRSEGTGRSFAFGLRIGALTRTVAGQKMKDAAAFLRSQYHLDPRAAEDLVHYIKSQKKSAGTLPTDEVIVIERVPDELGDLRICILSPFGIRVHAPWAMAVLRRLRDERAGDIEAVWSNDGMVFRVPGGEAPPPVDLFLPPSSEIEDIVTHELHGSSMFAARFREAAARALLLPRRAVGKRTPLWALRKRAADLLSVASQYPSFPIVLEAYREVLRDGFDLPSLTLLLNKIETRQIRVDTVDTPTPSPFAASLMFNFVGNFLYDDDSPIQERRASALAIDHAQLRELLGESELRRLLDPHVLEEHERALQGYGRVLRHEDGVLDLLLSLGDQKEAEILERAPGPDEARLWIASLLETRRILRVRIAGDPRFIATQDASRYRDGLGVMLPPGLPEEAQGEVRDALTGLVARYARTHGPFLAQTVAERWGTSEASVIDALATLERKGKVLRGTFLPKAPSRTSGPEYCDTEVLRALKQKSLARLRKAIAPVDPSAFTRFLLEWQGVLPSPNDGTETRRARRPSLAALLKVVTQLQGMPLPISVLESDILPARVPGYEPFLLDQLLGSGRVVWAGLEPLGQKDGRIAFYLSDHEALLSRAPSTERPQTALHDRIREAFSQRGALFLHDLIRLLGVFHHDAVGALWDLVWAGEVTNDTFDPLRALVGSSDRRRSWERPRGAFGPSGTQGRWSLCSQRRMGSPSSTERATAIAQVLLERYGVVLREAPSAEGLPGGFAQVYDVYRAMEEQSRIRRGYFVQGRGALQFALPGAEQRLRSHREIPPGATARSDLRILAATDPANPHGALWPWPASSGRSPQRVPGAHCIFWRGHLLGWLSKGEQHLVTFLEGSGIELSQGRELLAQAMTLLARQAHGSVRLSTIDGDGASLHPMASALRSEGFTARGERMEKLRSHRDVSDSETDEEDVEVGWRSHGDGGDP